MSLEDFFICRNYSTASIPLCSGTEPQQIEVLQAASTADDLTCQILWPVARAAAAFVAQAGARGELRGRACLELGAGCGIIGLVASRFATSVVLTDGEEEALSLLERNRQHASPFCKDVRIARLRWGDAEDTSALQVAAGRERWDVLLGADVVYWPAGIEPLCDSVATLLAADGIFFLGYNDRLPGNRERLLNGLAVRGLQAVVAPLDSFEVIDLPEASRPKITMYLITWTPASRSDMALANSAVVPRS